MHKEIDTNKILINIALTLYSISLLILSMDLSYLLKINIVNTIGRISLIGPNIYLFTGSLLFDQIIFWILMLISTIISIEIHNDVYRYLPIILSFLGLSSLLILNNTYLSIYIAIAILFITIILFTKNSIINKAIHSMLLVIAMLESLKTIYLMIKLLTGVYPWFNTPLYINIVIWYLLWPLIPILLIVIALYSIFRILENLQIVYGRTLSRIKYFFRYLKYVLYKQQNLSREDSNSRSYLYILIGILSSIAMGIIPYISTLNPMLRPVNTDWIYYYSWLNSMIRNDFTVLAIYSDRSLYLVLLYMVWHILRIDPKAIAIYHNISLLPLYTLSIYILAKRWLGSNIANYTALIAPFSPIFLSFIYGGFQANLFAISIVFISLYLLMGSRRQIFYGLLLFSLTMFIHEWTWTQYIFIFTGYIILRAIGRVLDRWKICWRDRILLYYLLIGYGIDISKNMLFNMFSSIGVIERIATISIMPYLESIHFYTTIFTGGTLNNPLFYIILLLGIDALAIDLPSTSIILPLIPVLIPWNEITYRLILNTPLTILSGYGLSRVGLRTRVLLIASFIGIGLWRLYTIIPELSLTP